MEEVEEEQWRPCNLCYTNDFTVFNSMRSSHRNSRTWLRACPCIQPHHRQCLQYWVWICEAQRAPEAPRCPQCRALFRVKPAKDPVINALDDIAQRWYPKFCKTLAVGTALVLQECASVTFGFFILCKVYGFHEASALLMNMDPTLAVIVCNLLPQIAIVINNIPWEEHFLRMLHRSASLPVLGAVMPKGGPGFQLARRPSYRTCGAVVGGLLLPCFAEVTSHLLFRTTESPVKHFLLGGVLFLVVRGIFYMYHRQKTFTRQTQLAVANYVHPHQAN